MRLHGLRACVTGAGRGIGREIALAFAREGCGLVCIARTEAELEDTAAVAREMGRHVSVHPCDLSQPADVTRALGGILESGPVDILVNNAGYACFKPVHELSVDEWEHTLSVNLTGAFLCTTAVLPGMMARRSGRIINISSVAGVKPIAKQSAYCASKAGLIAFSKVLALELREYGIAVHALCPGGVKTRLADDAMPERDKSGWMTPDDIASTAIYLATLPPRAAVDTIVVRRFDSEPLGV